MLALCLARFAAPGSRVAPYHYLVRGPLRTVHAAFIAHGSSLHEAMKTGRQRTECCARLYHYKPLWSRFTCFR